MALFGNFGDLYKKKDHLQYVNDYSDELYEDENGKTRRRSVYIGPHIPIRNELRNLRLILAGAVLLTLILIAALVTALFLNHTTAWFFLVTIPLAVAAFPALYLVMGVMHLPFSGKPMQRDSYMHGIVRMFRSCGAIIAIMAVILAAEFIYRFMNNDWIFLRDDIFFMLLIAAVIVSGIGIIMLLRAVDVDEIEMNLMK